ncbi:MAG: tRNA preQ1(34) S-adenosylmethionine ribosyltransferase-isomerase QueA, partial [Candidatus Omnitrophica bacterium]|nr:tRNA preQ1(34) S-adenosylmethionine ribosyltransferase-isomerase QueA [Candidatus Omnitrophota bacterium]
ARLPGKKETGGNIEVFLLKKETKWTWNILIRGRIKTGQKFILPDIEGKIIQRNPDGSFIIEFSTDKEEEILKHGEVPLPPYIKRPPVEIDKEYYQTVYAEKPGAVAAPTAGLHFTKKMLDNLIEKRVNVCFLTLYIGWPSFKTIKGTDIETVGEEFFEINKETADMINYTKEKGKKIFAVGTSCVRALESSVENGKIIPDSKWTNLFIKEGFDFKIVDSLITNFHLPFSTHLELVCAFGGIQLIEKAYDIAIEKQYRFYSYGDAMLILGI